MLWDTCIYYYQNNNRDYKRYRNAYKLRKAGLVDEFTVDGVEIVSLETLESAQEQLRENRDMSLLSGVFLRFTNCRSKCKCTFITI